MINLKQKILNGWKRLREMTGDDAYDRYLQHWQSHHDAGEQPLDRETFYRQQTEHRWNGIKRCC